MSDRRPRFAAAAETAPLADFLCARRPSDNAERKALGRPIAAAKPAKTPPLPVVHSIDWYAPGDCRVFDVAGVRLTVRLVDRKGRRARVAVQATTDDRAAP